MNVGIFTPDLYFMPGLRFPNQGFSLSVITITACQTLNYLLCSSYMYN